MANVARDVRERTRQGLDGLRVFDVHTHLGGPRQARTLADIVSYHWLSSELERAAGGRLGADPRGDPPAGGPDAYMEAAAPHFAAIRNTSNHYAFMGILRDLYGVKARTLTADNWRGADEAVRSHAEDEGRLAAVLGRAKIERLTVAARDGMPDSSGRYVPYEYGESVYMASSPETLKHLGAGEGGAPGTPDELEAGIAAKVDRLATKHGARAIHLWCPGSWTYVEPDRLRVEQALGKVARGEELTTEEVKELASFSADATAEAAARHGIVLQLFHGMKQRGGLEGRSSVPVSIDVNCEWLGAFARHFGRHPETTFDLFLGARAPGNEAASLSRVFPNVMVSGAWWHGFTPSTLSSFFRDRLEMLPMTAWNAFYSDGYIVEWIYGKLLVTKNRLAHALAGMVDEGFLADVDDALDVARTVLYENAARAYGA